MAQVYVINRMCRIHSNNKSNVNNNFSTFGRNAAVRVREIFEIYLVNDKRMLSHLWVGFRSLGEVYVRSHGPFAEVLRRSRMPKGALGCFTEP